MIWKKILIAKCIQKKIQYLEKNPKKTFYYYVRAKRKKQKPPSAKALVLFGPPLELIFEYLIQQRFKTIRNVCRVWASESLKLKSNNPRIQFLSSIKSHRFELYLPKKSIQVCPYCLEYFKIDRKYFFIFGIVKSQTCKRTDCHDKKYCTDDFHKGRSYFPYPMECNNCKRTFKKRFHRVLVIHQSKKVISYFEFLLFNYLDKIKCIKAILINIPFCICRK